MPRVACAATEKHTWREKAAKEGSRILVEAGGFFHPAQTVFMYSGLVCQKDGLPFVVVVFFSPS